MASDGSQHRVKVLLLCGSGRVVAVWRSAMQRGGKWQGHGKGLKEQVKLDCLLEIVSFSTDAAAW